MRVMCSAKDASSASATPVLPVPRSAQHRPKRLQQCMPCVSILTSANPDSAAALMASKGAEGCVAPPSSMTVPGVWIRRTSRVTRRPSLQPESVPS